MSAPAIISSGTAAGGPPVGGSGTSSPSTIPRWTGPSTLGDSGLIDNGTAIYTTTRNVGIGTVSPLAPLDVRDATVSGLGVTSIYTGAITAGQGGALTFGGFFTGTSPTTWSKIVGGKDNATAGDFGGHLQFLTRPNGGSLAERARIDSSGNVGIGTASPAGRLDVVGVAGLSWAIRAQVSSANTSPALNAELGLNLKNTSSTVGNYTSITNRDSADNANTQINFINVNNSGSGAINFVTRDSVSGSAERARIDSAGNFSLGANPTTGNRIVMGGIGSGTSYIKGNEGVVQIGNIFAGPVQILTADTPQVTVTGGGNVGIGTPNPGAILHTLGTGTTTGIFATSSANAWVELRRSTSTTLGYIGTGSGLVTGGAAADLAFRCESGNLLFSTVATERARIDSAGNCGINNASPSSYDAGARNLVVGSGTGNQGITIAGSGNLNLYFATGTTGGDPYRGYIRYTAAGDAFTFATASTVRASLGGSSLDISSTSGYGLKLPATPGNADAQTLDCYQDGGSSAGGLSWTPTLSAAATWGGTAPTVLNARYTRIGNIVFCTVTLDPTGGVAFSATYGTSTITAPTGLSATTSTVVPSNRGGVSANGAQGANTVYIPTYALSTNSINVSWFFAV